MFVEKCCLSLAMTSVRPVNRLLGFGVRGMTPSDVVLLPEQLLWMCICPRRYQISSPKHLHNNRSTHSVSGIEGCVASHKVVSTGKNARSAHVEIPKVERLRMREGRKERKGAPGGQETPNYATRRTRVLIYFYIHYARA